MPTIEIDPDIYEFLRSRVRDFRETESKVLRRELNLPEPGDSVSTTAVSRQKELAQQSTAPLIEGGPLARFVTDPAFRYQRTATDKFLAILGFAEKQDPEGFQKVFQLAGRQRKYFGRSEQEIERSGTSTHPRQIPGTQCWAMTNADTQQKREMLRQALDVLGYSADDIATAEQAVS